MTPHTVSDRDLRAALKPFTAPDNLRSVAALMFDICLYVGAVFVAAAARSVPLQLIAGILAGAAIARLFVLGHDAVHRSLFSSRLANAIAARVAFAPALHNVTLWRQVHNAEHHQQTNVAGLNSFSPLTPLEYLALPSWRRAAERLFRHPLGLGVCYMVRRWWAHKFLPRPGAAGSAWADLGLLLAIVAAQLALLVWLAGDAWSTAVLFAVVLPYLVWNQLIGLTVWLQHTHPDIAWRQEEGGAGVLTTTPWVRGPGWWDALWHNIMAHPSHHVSARIPWHRLPRAMAMVSELSCGSLVISTFGPRHVLRVARECQLYDYDAGAWMRFSDVKVGWFPPSVRGVA